MRTSDGNGPTWRFFDGAVSISASMLLAILLGDCRGCGGLPVLGYLNALTEREAGVIIAATLLLFPTSMAFYGGMIVFFAAKEFVEKRAVQRGRRQERERIQRKLAEQGVPLTPEQLRILSRENGLDETE